MTGECDIDRFALYTKLTDFTGWIKKIVEKPWRKKLSENNIIFPDAL